MLKLTNEQSLWREHGPSICMCRPTESVTRNSHGLMKAIIAYFAEGLQLLHPVIIYV